MTDTQRTSERRIGVLVPAGNIVHEYEFARMRPEGVHFRFAPFQFPARDAADFCGALTEFYTPGLQEMRAWGAELVLIGCTTASMLCGAPDQIAQLEKIAGVPVITAASAVREAIAALGLRSVAAATPYSDGSNKIVADFLTRSGLKDSTVRGLGFDTSPQVWREKATTVTPEEIQAFCASIDQPSADALYLPCTGVRSVEALAALEQQCNKPAFSSVQAGFWAALRRLGVNGRQDGFGRLISTWDYASA